MDDSESGMSPLGCIEERSRPSCGMSRGARLSGLTAAGVSYVPHMTTAAVRPFNPWAGLAGAWMTVLVMALPILTDLLWPGSIRHTLAQIAFFTYFAVWLGLKIRRGYSRRRPHWTRESWHRYLRLAVLPVVAITLLLLLSSIDISLFGAPQSATRSVWIVIMLAMLFVGGLGLPVAIDWLEKGEPTEQFTRTSWFQRRSRTTIAG